MLWLPGNVSSSRRGVHREEYIPTTEEILIEDFETWDAGTRDFAWLDTQPLNTVAMLSYSKHDGGNGQEATVVCDPTGGVGGSKALKVTTETGSNRLPGCWMVRWKKTGSGVASIPPGTTSYFVQPHEEDLTGLRLRVKFDVDYRATSGASGVTTKEYNWTIGTYQNTHANVASNPEQYNWHHYHNFFLRHDLINNDWFDVEINCMPYHQRNGLFGMDNPSVQMFEPVLYEPDGTPLGSYISHCTRMYFDSLQYTDDPEISRPCSMWIDSIYAIKRPPANYLTITPTDYTDGEQMGVVIGSDTITIHFDVTNNTGASYTALALLGGYYRMAVAMSEDGVGSVSNGSAVTWSNGETKSFTLTSTPDSLAITNVGNVRPVGCTFMPQSETEDGGTSYRNRSNRDTNVENRRNVYEGKIDAYGLVSTRVNLIRTA